MTGIEEVEEEGNRESHASNEIDTTAQPAEQQENETLYIIEGIFQDAVAIIEEY